MKDEIEQIKIEGSNVRIEHGKEGSWITTSEGLPGVVASTENEKDIESEMNRLIHVYLIELVRNQPTIKAYNARGRKPREQASASEGNVESPPSNVIAF
jgi:hypothetical protein